MKFDHPYNNMWPSNSENQFLNLHVYWTYTLNYIPI